MQAPSCVLFGFWTPKSDKQWKSVRVVWKNLPMGIPSGNQTVLRGCAPQDSIITLGTSLEQIFPDNPAAFHWLSQRRRKKRKTKNIYKKFWQLKRDMWHVTHDTWYVTCYTWHMTGGGRWTLSQNFSPLALTVWEWRCIEDISTKDDWLS